MREEGTALSLVASVRYNPREGFRRRLRLEVEDLHRNRIQRRTKSDFSKFRFPAESRSHPSIFLVVFLSRKLWIKSGERIVSRSVFLFFHA